MIANAELKGIAMSIDRSKALRSGLGSIEDVACELANLPEDEGELADAIKQAAKLLIKIAYGFNSSGNVAALLCASMNVSFRETGMLWRTDNKGRACNNYITASEGRDAIADLAGL